MSLRLIQYLVLFYVLDKRISNRHFKPLFLKYINLSIKVHIQYISRLFSHYFSKSPKQYLIYCDTPKPKDLLTNRQPAKIPVDIVYLGTHAV